MLKILFLTIILTSCGNAFRFSKLPITFNVPESRYYQFKAQFDETEDAFKSKSGKDLVLFVPRKEDPKYSTYQDAKELYTDYGEMWILFKDDSSQFTNIDSGTAGLAWSDSAGAKDWGLIYMNFSINMWSDHNFRQVLFHEVFHVLGFPHTFDDDYSIMNYDYIYKVAGMTSFDEDRLIEKYPFSLLATSVKDLEKIGSRVDDEKRKKLEGMLVERFGLSEDRAGEISGTVYSLSRIKEKRSLTPRELSILSYKILGFDYGKGKKALEKHIQGDTEDLENLMRLAAETNETTPEHVRELLGEYLL
ncbi:MAG: hypothetical protein E2O68_02600 [Deltaproteobacteria bacterium]|nr:MAG: hypothetical protein E2O68_02600 [Deltaproteobacteria bacterium]